MRNNATSLDFKVLATSPQSRARAGTLKTLHNEVLTPLFMPVGTQASVRNVGAPKLLEAGSQILLANTYHLFLRPGKEVFEKFGGIHNFMKWNKSVLTDSGGYQVFSLSQSRKITEEGVKFESYVDGQIHMLSPETSIGMQKSINSDIMMAMDVCIPSTSDYTETQKAMEQTHRWAVRSLEARGDSRQALFGIVQGACHKDLREKSAKFISSLPFDGYAIGGLAVGETKEEREIFTELVTDFLPQNFPRYLMGVGTPLDLLEAVHRGVDMFDCIIPTKLAEQGVVYTSKGRLQLIRGAYKFSDEPLDENCECSTCQTYSRAYLHHLVKTCEPLSTQILGLHNISFYHSLMRQIRESILNQNFISFYNEWREKLDARDAIPNSVKVKVGRRPDRRPESMGDYEVVKSSDKLWSIRHVPSKEVMHPGSNPMSEAISVYLEQSGLVEKLQNLKKGEELVVWDVGLGAAFNAMAVVEASKKTNSEGKLTLISFERDLDPLKLALCHPTMFPHLKHGGPHAIIDGNTYETEQLKWQLFEGDFLDTFTKAPPADIIFFDPFSSKTDAPLWTLETFQKLFHFLQSYSKNSALFNYTASTVMRARMLLAGFHVAYGKASPPKAETTIALTKAERSPYKLLDQQWYQRFLRSDIHSQISTPSDVELHFEGLKKHPQFVGISADLKEDSV